MHWGDGGGFSECGQLLLRSVLSGSWGSPLPTPHPYIVIKGPCLLGLSLPRLSRSHGKEQMDKNQPKLPHPCVSWAAMPSQATPRGQIRLALECPGVYHLGSRDCSHKG